MLERLWRKGNPLTLLVGMQTSTATMENLKKLEIELPYDPAIPLLGIHTEETRIERDTCTPIFIAALFIIARTWKQPRCPSLLFLKNVLVLLVTKKCELRFFNCDNEFIDFACSVNFCFLYLKSYYWVEAFRLILFSCFIEPFTSFLLLL